MTPPVFDGYIVVDWSASSVPKTGKDSIWIATMPRDGALLMENPSTRLEAYEILKQWLVDAATRGERWLVGFDFPFGYPAGTAKAITGGGWAELWARIAEVIEEGPKNANNRFDAAAKLNAEWSGEGPFWANGLKRDIEGLPRKLPKTGYGETLPPRLRQVEGLAKGTQETWKLAGAGSVGGQALTGIAMLERLRHVTHARVWPFETMGKGSAHVLAEIFPSLLEPHPDEAIRDAGQVRSVVEAVQAWDKSGDLALLLEVPGRVSGSVIAEEGWILGAGSELKSAPRPTRRKLCLFCQE